MKPAISIRALCYAYGRDTVLEEMTVDVPQGKILTILGPNGSGKTTLLKLMTGTLKPQAGSLKIFDRPIQSYSTRSLARTLAVVPQHNPVNFPFTVEEVVLMGRSPHLGLLEIEKYRDFETARRAMDLVSISHLANRRIDQLSGGEQQRVFIARAICQEPRIVLLDEPTSSLDLTHQIEIMEIMRKLAREKDITIVTVSHDLNLSAMYGDRMLLMKKGRVLGMGRPCDVLLPQKLQTAYGCPLLVDRHPIAPVPRVTLVPPA